MFNHCWPLATDLRLEPLPFQALQLPNDSVFEVHLTLSGTAEGLGYSTLALLLLSAAAFTDMGILHKAGSWGSLEALSCPLSMLYSSVKLFDVQTSYTVLCCWIPTQFTMCWCHSGLISLCHCSIKDGVIARITLPGIE